jgi:hypothetical protein
MTTTAAVLTQQKWEYCNITRKTDGPLLAECNILGQDGWEMVDVLYYKDMKGVMCWTAFLKRTADGHTSGPASQANPADMVYRPSKPSPNAPSDAEGFDLGDGDFDFKSE